MSTTAGVSSRRGVMKARERISAEKKPNFSARPIPSMATKINPSAGSPVKFRSIEESIQ